MLKARELHLAGATVLRGPMGFGHSSRLHTAKILRLSSDLPIMIEIVDAEEKINAFLPMLDRLMGSGLVTLEKVRIRQYGLYRPRLVGHRTGAYAARAAGESCSCLMAAGGRKPCRSISQVAL